MKLCLKAALSCTVVLTCALSAVEEQVASPVQTPPSSSSLHSTAKSLWPNISPDTMDHVLINVSLADVRNMCLVCKDWSNLIWREKPAITRLLVEVSKKMFYESRQPYNTKILKILKKQAVANLEEYYKQLFNGFEVLTNPLTPEISPRFITEIMGRASVQKVLPPHWLMIKFLHENQAFSSPPVNTTLGIYDHSPMLGRPSDPIIRISALNYSPWVTPSQHGWYELSSESTASLDVFVASEIIEMKLEAMQGIEISKSRFYFGLSEYLQSTTKLGELNLIRMGQAMVSRIPCGLTALTYLYLENNALKTLPASIDKLPSLAELNLSGNNFPFFPTHKLTNLPQLVYLSLKRNPNIEITPRIAEVMPQLELLDLSYCNLQQLSTSLIALPKLIILNLSNNTFDVIPPVINFLSSLQQLNMSKNQIKGIESFPHQATTLTKLEIGQNPIPKAQIQNAMMNRYFPYIKKITY